MKLEIVRFDPTVHMYLVERLTTLLHAAYAPLAAAGMKYLASHQLPERTLRRLNEGEGYLGFMGWDLVATVTLNPSKSNSISTHYRRSEVYSFGQFAVAPELQQAGFGSKIMDFIEERALELGALELALDTSIHAQHLISLYQKRGYEIVERVHWDEVNYESHIMSKKLLRTTSLAHSQERSVPLL